MAHSHSHGEPNGSYFLDQLFTILLSGALGIAAISMYFNPLLLGKIVVPAFFLPILIGGIFVLLLALVRGVSLWQLAGKLRPAAPASTGHDHGHSHSHSHAHGHEHAHGDEPCGHDHGTDCGHDHSGGEAHGEEEHDHDHSWVPVRYMVLAVPFFLFVLGEPRRGYSDNDVKSSTGGTLQQSVKRQGLSMLAGGPALTRVLKKPTFEQRTIQLRFNELVEAAAVPALQERYEGDIGIIRGQFFTIPGTDSEFTLFRVDMTCCAADSRILETRIISPVGVASLGFNPGDWVLVQGSISFERDDKKKKWVPVLTLRLDESSRPPRLEENAVRPAQPTRDLNEV